MRSEKDATREPQDANPGSGPKVGGASTDASRSDDLVTRLRWHAMDRSNHYTSLTAEAAREIERLRGEIAMLRAVIEE